MGLVEIITSQNISAHDLQTFAKPLSQILAWDVRQGWSCPNRPAWAWARVARTCRSLGRWLQSPCGIQPVDQSRGEVQGSGQPRGNPTPRPAPLVLGAQRAATSQRETEI